MNKEPLIKQLVLYLGNKNKVKHERDFGDNIYRCEFLYIKNIPYKDFLQDPNTLIFGILGKYEKGDFESILKEIIGKALDFHQSGADIRLKDFLKDLEKISKLRKLQKEVKTQIDVILNEKSMKTVIEKIDLY